MRNHRDFSPTLETIPSDERVGWPPTPKGHPGVAHGSGARRRCRIEYIVVVLLVTSALTTMLSFAYTSADDEIVYTAADETHIPAIIRHAFRGSRAAATTTAAAAAVNISACQDDEPDCKEWAREQHCKENPGYMHVHCRRSCNRCAGVSIVDRNCADKSNFCGQWAAVGECESSA